MRNYFPFILKSLLQLMASFLFQISVWYLLNSQRHCGWIYLNLTKILYRWRWRGSEGMSETKKAERRPCPSLGWHVSFNEKELEALSLCHNFKFGFWFFFFFLTKTKKKRISKNHYEPSNTTRRGSKTACSPVIHAWHSRCVNKSKDSICSFTIT